MTTLEKITMSLLAFSFIGLIIGVWGLYQAEKHLARTEKNLREIEQKLRDLDDPPHERR